MKAQQMMPKLHRFLLLAAVLTAPCAHAWEFTPGTPCILTHETPDVSVELTYDPGVPLYTISLTTPAPLSPGPIFSMLFQGSVPLGISTDQHRLSNEGRTVTVTDRGFGNVLNGMQFNQAFVAVLGGQKIIVPLAGAADPVADFRLCTVVPTA